MEGSVYGGGKSGTVGSAHVKCENGGAGKITFDAGISRTAGDGEFQSVTADEITPQDYFEYLSADHYTISAIADPVEHAIICADETCGLKLTNATAPHSWNADGSCDACGYTFYDLWVGGVQVGGVPDGNGNITVTGDTITGTVTYAPSTKTLTLDGASITAAEASVAENNKPVCGIYSRFDLNLVLTDANTITASTTDYSAGVMADAANLTISGDGSLKINTCGYGINALKLVTNGVTLEIVDSVHAVSLTIGCTIEESTVSAVGSNTGISTANGLIKIDDSSVYAEGEQYSFSGTLDEVAVELVSGAHVKAEGTIKVNLGVNYGIGYLRTASGNSFEYKEGGNLETGGSYFEYVGEGHYTVSASGSEKHTIECNCTDEDIDLKLIEATAPHTLDADDSCDECGYTFYDLWVGGVRVSGARDAETIDVTALVNDESKVSGTVTYAPSTSTLTLSGAAIAAGEVEYEEEYISSSYGIYAHKMALNLVLTGNNRITDGAFSKGVCAGDSGEGNALTISGGGSLTIYGGEGAAGISGGSVALDGVTVDLRNCVIGIASTNGDVTIQSSTINADSVEHTVLWGHYGSINIIDSSVYTKSGGFYTTENEKINLSGSAHVKCESGIEGEITFEDGIYRTASAGDFAAAPASLAASGIAYFEYLGADHANIQPGTGTDIETHTISCGCEKTEIQVRNLQQPHRWIANADGATCGVCGATAAASVTADGTTAYYCVFDNAMSAAEGAPGSTLKLFDDVETITVKTGGFILDPNGKSITKLDFASGSSSIGIASRPANTPAVTTAVRGIFVTPSGVTLDPAWFTSAKTGYVVVKEGDNLELVVGIIENMVTLSSDSTTYNGGAQFLNVTVKWTDGNFPGVTLMKGDDYNVIYTDSEGNPVDAPTNADTYTVTIIGKGGYAGKVEKTYTINPKSLADAAVTAPNQTYTGSKLTPAVTVELTDYTITSDDYTVSYSPDTLTDAGEYEITITGKGNFTGTKNSTFEIKPVDISDRTANSPDQITIFGVGDFTEPTIPGVAGETVPGTFQYSITAANGATEVTDGDAAAVKASLATLEKDKDVVVNWTFSPTTGNYTGTKAGSFTVTAKDIEFKVGNDAASANNAINVLISSTEYGKTWNERVSLKTGSITASVGNTTVSGNYTIVPDDGVLTDRPGVGTHSYTVKFTGGGYTDVTVFTGSLTVTPKPVTVTADDVIVPLGTNMETVQFTYTVSGLCGTDTLTKDPVLALSADTDTSKEGEYTITPSGADAGSNYKMEYKTGLLKVRGQRTITVAAAANGKVSVSHNSAIEGTQVTITVTPDEGGEIDKVSITDKDGNPVDVTDNGGGTYTYEQPDGDVTIEVTFKTVVYEIVKGNGGKWTKGSTSALSFTANGPFSKFVGIEVDGKEVDKNYYEAEAASTIITLKASYLETLKTGSHTITVLYTGGETEGTFTVQAKPTSPATGDDSNIMLWSGMLCVSTLGLVVLLADRKRRRSTK